MLPLLASCQQTSTEPFHRPIPAGTTQPTATLPIPTPQVEKTSALSQIAEQVDEATPVPSVVLDGVATVSSEDNAAAIREAAATVRDVQPEPVVTTASDATPLDAVFDVAGVPPEWRSSFQAIGAAESHWNAAAIGDHGNSLGALQLWRGWFQSGEDPFDLVTNVRVGVRVRQYLGRFGGPGGWTTAAPLGIW